MTVRSKEKCTMTFLVALLQFFQLVHVGMVCALAACFVTVRTLCLYIMSAISIGDSINFLSRMHLVPNIERDLVIRGDIIAQVCLENFDAVYDT